MSDSKDFKPKGRKIPEKDFRKILMARALVLGSDRELKYLLDKYDKLLRNCSNMQEADHIKTLGIIEIYQMHPDLFSQLGGGLSINGQPIFDAPEGLESHGKIKPV